jgi:hypothetical protein
MDIIGKNQKIKNLWKSINFYVVQHLWAKHFQNSRPSRPEVEALLFWKYTPNP